MNWNCRHNGDWQVSTVKQRKNGHWVTVSGGGSGGGWTGDGEEGYPSYYYQGGPPERNGDIITYPADGHLSIQAAHDSLSEGDTLYLEPGTYHERLEINPDNSTDHISIVSDGELEFDSQGRPTVVSEGAWISNPSTDNYPLYIINSNTRSFPDDASIVGRYDGGGPEYGGEDTIEVSDTSPFSVGDIVSLWEDTRPWDEPLSGGATGSNETLEYHQIASMDSSASTLTFETPIYLPFGNDSSARVGLYEWAVNDIYFSGINIDGNGARRVVGIYALTNGWFDNMQVRDAGERALLHHAYGLRCRFDNIHLSEGGHYGFTVFNGATQPLITNIYSESHGRYTVRYGTTRHSSQGGLADGIYGIVSDDSFVANCHWGGFYHRYSNVFADASKVLRLRSRYTELDGFESDGCPTQEFALQQRPYHCIVKNGNIYNKPDGSNVVFWIDLQESTYGNTYAEDITFRNIDIEAYDGRDITEIGAFGTDYQTVVNGLHFENITYGGRQLERHHVESWNGYNHSNVDIQNLTVE